LACETVAKPLERGGVFVHDDDVVFVGDEQLREGRTHAPATDDQVSHGAFGAFASACVVPAAAGEGFHLQNPVVLVQADGA
jgi:hypothetical protein